MPGVFRFEHVGVRAGDQAILRDIDLEVDGGVTVLAGPSGAGKSTLLRLCNRLEVPTAGRVLFHGDDVAGLDPKALRRRVGMVFQRSTLFPGTVRDNLRVARADGTDARFADALVGVRLDPSFLDRRGDDLSGGEAQRACLARTLVTDPEVLLMDEPTSALDPTATRALEELARGLADGGVPVLWVTHDLHQAARLADRTVVLVDGQVADEADARRYLADDGQGTAP